MFSCLNLTQFATQIITAVIAPTCSVPEAPVLVLAFLNRKRLTASSREPAIRDKETTYRALTSIKYWNKN